LSALSVNTKPSRSNTFNGLSNIPKQEFMWRMASTTRQPVSQVTKQRIVIRKTSSM
jgi:hypothetical protein